MPLHATTAPHPLPRLAPLLLLLPPAAPHGVLNVPPARQGGGAEWGGSCAFGSCLWFTNDAFIPGPPALNATWSRTWFGDDDTSSHPWRAPGSAPVQGSGCGVAGGGVADRFDGVFPPAGVAAGADAAALPPLPARAAWRAGGVAEVAWSITVNHGGGYQYRLCPAGEPTTEACFQRNPLRFAGNVSYIEYTNGSRTAVPLVRVSAGTSPAGSEWARNPIPGCKCERPVPGGWCSDGMLASGGACPGRPCCPEKCGACISDGCAERPGGAAECCAINFARPCSNASDTACRVPAIDALAPTAGAACWGQGEPMFAPTEPALSGTGHPSQCGCPFAWNIVDQLEVPENLPAGDYVVSWRWDCEEGPQVWQACGDITVVSDKKPAKEVQARASAAPPAPAPPSPRPSPVADQTMCSPNSSPARCDGGRQCASGPLMTQGTSAAKCCAAGWTNCGNPYATPKKYSLCDGCSFGAAFPKGVCCPTLDACPAPMATSCPAGCDCA